MRKKERAEAVVQALKELYPDALCALRYKKDYELLIAVRLSAQCTDARVNLVTPALFAAYPTLESFANADVLQVEALIRSCGFYHHKARDIVLACQAIKDRFGGRVPDDMDELLTIPGVGRKTANLLLGDVYGQAAVVTDTHCIRISGRLGLTKRHAPEQVEEDLRKVLPPERSSRYCHQTVLFGRDTCRARNPLCAGCPLREFCVDPSFTKIAKK